MKRILCLFMCCSVINFAVVIGQGSVSEFPCVTKLMPCQPYLFDPKNVPATCCIPMREIITDESGCICKVLKNKDILKGLNVTIDQVLKLPKACGLKANPSICNSVATTGAPTAAPVKAGAPPPAKAKVSKSEGIRKTPYSIINVVGGAVLMFVFNTAFN